MTNTSSPRRPRSTASPPSTRSTPTRLSWPARTDVGLWITKQLRDIAKIIHVGKVATFDKIEDTGHELIIGAGATYAQVEPHLAKIDPDLGELLRRLGSKQVRASGTVGGNVANGSPIGDTPPALIALDAKVELRKGRQVRSMAGRGILHRVRQAEARGR